MSIGRLSHQQMAIMVKSRPGTMKLATILIQKHVFGDVSKLYQSCICAVEVAILYRFSSKLVQTLLSVIVWTISLAKRVL